MGKNEEDQEKSVFYTIILYQDVDVVVTSAGPEFI